MKVSIQKTIKAGKKGLSTPCKRRADQREEQSASLRGCAAFSPSLAAANWLWGAWRAWCWLLPTSPPQHHCNNSCKCEDSRDKGRSSKWLRDSCRQTIL